MAAVALTGQDTIKINQRILADFASGDVATLSFPNELANLKTGKNGNSIYALNETGKQADLVLKVIRGSLDDKYLQSLITSQTANFSNFILVEGEFVKKIGDGQGNVTSDIYIIKGGIFVKQVEAKTNTEADIEQGISTYTLRFANSPRALV